MVLPGGDVAGRHGRDQRGSEPAVPRVGDDAVPHPGERRAVGALPAQAGDPPRDAARDLRPGALSHGDLAGQYQAATPVLLGRGRGSRRRTTAREAVLLPEAAGWTRPRNRLSARGPAT